jgi:hypothetical protein
MASLRNEVIQRWLRAGAPVWSDDKTVLETELADQNLESLGDNPAVRFREERKKPNKSYEAVFVAGYKFPWLEMQRLGFDWHRKSPTHTT